MTFCCHPERSEGSLTREFKHAILFLDYYSTKNAIKPRRRLMDENFMLDEAVSLDDRG